ncbi:sigma-70 family RNA polymerase sigma factor [Thalassoglobus sp. JC818]|uniref:RNA polymerase sigma factor n=1 Tax=Thalassoglobus sp. JC818 TaxID=3232136 RepID=UPI0034593B2E
MSDLPTTRWSLLQRVQNADDDDAWREFLQIYQSAIYRYARRKGLQPADAEDLVQRVFANAAEKMKTWHLDRQSGSFRAWLLVVTRNAVVNAATRSHRHHSLTNVDEHAVSGGKFDSEEEAEIELELRRATFRKVVEKIRDEFSDSTWMAFWRTAVDGHSKTVVANDLDISIGSLYAARSRVMKRLREGVLAMEDET